MFNTKTNFIFITVLFLISVSSSTISAQFFVLKKTPQEKISVDLRFVHPIFDDNKWGGSISERFYSGTYDIDFSIPVSSNLNFNLLIPYRFGAGDLRATKGYLGNIGIGIQTRKNLSEIRKLNFSVCLFLPTSSDKNFGSLEGALFNYYDLQKYFPNSFAVQLNSENRWDFLEGHILKIEGGVRLLRPSSTEEVDLLINLGAGGGVKIYKFIALAEFATIANLSAKTESFGDKFINSFGMGINYSEFKLKPGIFYRVYLEDSFGPTSFTGFNLTMDF